MLRVSVLSRNNDFIIKVLRYLKSEDKFSTLSVSPAEDTEIERNTCELCHSDPFKYAVLLSIMNKHFEGSCELLSLNLILMLCELCAKCVQNCNCTSVHKTSLLFKCIQNQFTGQVFTKLVY